MKKTGGSLLRAIDSNRLKHLESLAYKLGQSWLENSLMTVADNGGGIGFVFGSAFAGWKNLNFRNHSICLQVDDHPAAENFLGDMRCDPLQAMADLINHLSARGISMKAGDFVSTGAATVPQAFARGSCVTADFGIIGKIQLTFV